MNWRKKQREHANEKSSEKVDLIKQEELEFNQTFPSNTPNCIQMCEGSGKAVLCKKAAVAEKEKELPLFIFNQAKRRRKWKELMCVWVLMAVTSLCWAHKWTIASVSIETCLERYECVRFLLILLFFPSTHFFQLIFKYLDCIIFFLSYMKRAFKPRAVRSKSWSLVLFAQRMCGINLQVMCAHAQVR